jgi:hypothetical protein
MTDSTEDLSGKFLPLEQDLAHPGSPTSQDFYNMSEASYLKKTDVVPGFTQLTVDKIDENLSVFRKAIEDAADGLAQSEAFRAIVYFRKVEAPPGIDPNLVPMQVVIAYRGSAFAGFQALEGGLAGAIQADTGIALGQKPTYFQEAVDLYKQVQQNIRQIFPNNPVQIFVTGHSLGGGSAEFVTASVEHKDIQTPPPGVFFEGGVTFAGPGVTAAPTFQGPINNFGDKADFVAELRASDHVGKFSEFGAPALDTATTLALISEIPVYLAAKSVIGVTHHLMSSYAQHLGLEEQDGVPQTPPHSFNDHLTSPLPVLALVDGPPSEMTVIDANTIKSDNLQIHFDPIQDTVAINGTTHDKTKVDFTIVGGDQRNFTADKIAYAVAVGDRSTIIAPSPPPPPPEMAGTPPGGGSGSSTPPSDNGGDVSGTTLAALGDGDTLVLNQRSSTAFAYGNDDTLIANDKGDILVGNASITKNVLRRPSCILVTI